MPQSPPWEAACDNPCFYGDRNLIITIHRVEVRWHVITIEHGNHNAQEPGYLWHLTFHAGN
jgi:hypothetical protein